MPSGPGSTGHCALGCRRTSRVCSGVAGSRDDRGLAPFLPRRYIDRSVEALIAGLPEGQEATVVGQVVSTETIPGRRAKGSDDRGDDSGAADVRVGLDASARAIAYEPGDWIAVAGKLNRYRGRVQMVHPEVEALSSGDDEGRLHTGRVIPLYTTTEDMKQVGLSTRDTQTVHSIRDRYVCDRRSCSRFGSRSGRVPCT